MKFNVKFIMMNEFLPMQLVSEEWSDITNVVSLIRKMDSQRAKSIYYFLENAMERWDFLLEV